MLGCNKTDVSRWEHNPCSTHALVKSKKLDVVRKMEIYLGLHHAEAEKMANKAGFACNRYFTEIGCKGYGRTAYGTWLLPVKKPAK